MRISGLSLGAALAVATAASLVATPAASAQRSSHRSDRRSNVASATAPVAASDQSPLSADSCGATCGDYSLAVVSALLPAETPGATSNVVTLVIENRGTATAPISFVSVAPQTRLASARRSAIPALAPGERTTVELPVASGPDGTACISITIMPAPAQDPATAQFLASATSSSNERQPSIAPDLPYWPDLPLAPVFQSGGWHSAGYPGILPDPGEFSAYDVSGYYGVSGTLG